MNEAGRKAFLDAVVFGSIERVHEFLDSGLEVATACPLGIHALYKAIQFHRVEIAKLLLQNGVAVDSHHPDHRSGQTPLMLAVRGKCRELVDLLLDFGADIHAIDAAGSSVLMHAISAESDVDYVIPILLDRGADANYSNSIGDSPLFNAALFGYVTVIEKLLAHGADPGIRCRDQTPLDVALAHGRSEAAEILRESSNTCAGNKQKVLASALINAAGAFRDRSHEQVKKLLLDGADPNSSGRNSWSPLIAASHCGNIKTMKALINAGATINAAGFEGNTALHTACRSAQLEAVALLLLHNANPDAKNDGGETPLIAAIQSAHRRPEIVARLLENGALASAGTRDGKSALELAAELGEPEIAEMLAGKVPGKSDLEENPLLLSHLFAAVDSRNSEELESILNQNPSIPLPTLVKVALRTFERNEDQCLEVLLRGGLDPNARDEKGNPLALAVIGDRLNPRVLETFFDLGYDMHRCNSQGNNILHALAEAGGYSYGVYAWHDRPQSYAKENINYCVRLARKAVARGAEVLQLNNKGRSPLMVAAESAPLEMLDLFLDHGAKINEQDKQGRTTLMCAAKAGDRHFEHVRALLSRGADPSLRDTDGRDAVAWATVSGATKIAERLLKSRKVAGGSSATSRMAPPNPRALIDAAARGKLEMVQMLLKQGAEINAVDQDRKTALYHAVERRHTEVAALLLAKGADPNLADKERKTPLHALGSYGNLNIARLLIEKGANVNARNQYGMTPAFYAVGGFRPKLLALLKENGAKINTIADAGYTALMSAARSAQQQSSGERVKQTFELLIDAGIDVNAVDEYGHSALEYLAGAMNYSSASKEHEGILAAGEVLLAHGADKDHRSKEGSPLEHAERLGFKKLAELIRTGPRKRS